jgi:hypothetical protein
MARNRIVQSFLKLTTDPNDVVVMLDCDHMHPQEIVSRLVSYHPEEFGVVAALYFRRGPPYDPLFFKRVGNRLRNPATWQEGMMYEIDAVATGAMAIRRWVFEKLDAAGLGYPYFQYTYPEANEWSMTEDIFFAERCQEVGVYHYCDTGIITPHITTKLVTKEDWDAWMKENPDITEEGHVAMREYEKGEIEE